MKKLLLTIAAAGMTLATGAFAQDATTAPDFASVDADSSGGVSLAEAQAIWPDLTQEAFTAADANADGSLDQTEFDAYVATVAGGAMSSGATSTQ
jgi:hypothetical protein